MAKLTRPNQPASAQTGLEAVSVKTPSGRPVSGMVAVPATIPAPAVLLIHGSGGLNDDRDLPNTLPGMASLRLPLISLTGEQPMTMNIVRS